MSMVVTIGKIRTVKRCLAIPSSCHLHRSHSTLLRRPCCGVEFSIVPEVNRYRCTCCWKNAGLCQLGERAADALCCAPHARVSNRKSISMYLLLEKRRTLPTWRTGSGRVVLRAACTGVKSQIDIDVPAVGKMPGFANCSGVVLFARPIFLCRNWFDTELAAM